MARHELCKIMTTTRTIRQSCHVSAKAKLCAVSSLHVDLGLPVFVLFGTLFCSLSRLCARSCRTDKVHLQQLWLAIRESGFSFSHAGAKRSC